jgi:formate dehydrogenase maturation protein FdhE
MGRACRLELIRHALRIQKYLEKRQRNLSNRPTFSPWQRRIHRAQDLAGQHPFAKEILEFYIHVARFQEDLHQRLSTALPPQRSAPTHAELSPDELENLSSRFESFLSLGEGHGPKPLAELSRDLRAHGGGFYSDLLQNAWTAPSSSDAQGLLAAAFLQPYAELLRSRASPRAAPTAHALCPFCNRRPGFGLLRQMGDGGARSMVCSFCLAEWEFRRIVCPACGEEDDKKLAVYTASGFDYIRVECCDACKTYIKSVDLTKNGRAEPLVDELASAPLDLWAREQGYAKLQSNLLGI